MILGIILQNAGSPFLLDEDREVLPTEIRGFRRFRSCRRSDSSFRRHHELQQRSVLPDDILKGAGHDRLNLIPYFLANIKDRFFDNTRAISA